MLDPLSALNVATATVQFVDFSYKCVHGIIETYHSIDRSGHVSLFDSLKTAAKRLRSSNARLINSLDRNHLRRPPTEAESQIVAVATECTNVAAALLSALQEFDTPEPDPRTWMKKCAKLKAALKVAWNKENVETLQQKLKDMRDQLSFVILLELREDIKQFSIQLASREDRSRSIWKSSSGIGGEILEQVKYTNQWQKNLELALRDIFESSNTLPPPQDSKVYGKAIRFHSWQETPFASSLVAWLLQHLRFSEMSIRQNRVAHAYSQTFEWIFTEPTQKIIKWYSFVDWLRGDDRLYWITGKAGSGKSTLMKFLLEDERTEKHLREWANDTSLVIASYYFWLAGTEQLQHSHEGLLRTLLYQVLDQLKEISPETALAQWETLALLKDFETRWTWTDLEQAFRLLLDDQSTKVKYCFFIDGLDELKGDQSYPIAFIRKISHYPNVKVCVSSRPWVIFGDEFSAKPNLMLQDLTLPDIQIYVTSKLGSNVAFKELQLMDDRVARNLIDEIVRKSSGVFLWVVLVVLSLEEGLRDGDRLSDLRRRLDSLPPELDDLFRRILHNFDPRYMSQACALFQMVKAAPGPLSLLSLSLADEDDTKLAVQAKVGPTLFWPKQRFSRALNMRRRLDSRCKGLLEAAPVWIKDNTFSQSNTSPETDFVVIKQNKRIPGVVVTTAPDNDMPSNAAILRDFSNLPPERGDLLANAEVEYLHRTVKDFLDQPDVWEQIVSATDPKFNPHLALARSYLLRLKWVHYNPAPIVSDEVWDTINNMIEHCAWADAEGVVDLELLDELGRRISMLFPPSGNFNSTQNGTSCIESMLWPFKPPNGQTDLMDFLHLAVRAGLPLYIDHKLGLMKHDDRYIESLLKAAISEAYSQFYGPKRLSAQSEQGPQLVRMLLRHRGLSDDRRKFWLQNAQKPTKDGSDIQTNDDMNEQHVFSISHPSGVLQPISTSCHSDMGSSEQSNTSFDGRITSSSDNQEQPTRNGFTERLLRRIFPRRKKTSLQEK